MYKTVSKIINKEWGFEKIIINNNDYCGKILHFKKDRKFSMHFHLKKNETWYVSYGSFILYWIDTDIAVQKEMILIKGDVLNINQGQPHQLLALEESEIFEVSTQHFDDDSYRVIKGDSQITKKVWINGTFDVLHIGHMKLFEYAKQFGDIKIGVDTDERVKSLKGNNRPINGLNERIDFLLQIKYINNVVSFGSDEELKEEIKKYNPDVMVIGDDYKNKKIIGSEFIPEILFFEKIPYKSTTNILKNK